MTKAKRVAIYARKSDDSDPNEQSTPAQVTACERWALARGYVVVERVQELGSGVTGEDRPAFVELVARAKSLPRPFDVIVCLDISRFGRFDILERGFWLHPLRKAGVEVTTVLDGEAVSGPNGDIVGAVFQHGAHEHSVKTGYKVALGLAASVEAGNYPCGAAPYGYTFRDGSRQLVLDRDRPERIAVVRRIFDAYESGSSPLAITARLNADGIPSPRGREWTRDRIVAILASPVYAGDVVLGLKRRGHALTPTKFYRVSAAGPAPKDQEAAPVVKRDAHDAIISREQFDRVQARFEARSQIQTGGRPLLLSGLARCGACGGPMGANGSNTTKKYGRYDYLACVRFHARHRRSDQGACARVRIRHDKLSAVVLETLRGRLADPGRLERELRAAAASMVGTPPRDVVKLERERKALLDRAARRALAAGSDELADAVMAQARADAAQLSREIDAARAVQARGLDVEAAIREAVESVRLLAPTVSPEQEAARRERVRTYVDRIEVRPAARGAPRPVSLSVYTPKALAFLATHLCPQPHATL